MSEPAAQTLRFPKSCRILKPKDYRNVYDKGIRVPCRTLVGFCLRVPGLSGVRVGFTTSRALGKAASRNRIRRRLKEAVRLRLDRLPQEWMVVFNGRRAALTAPFPAILEEVERVFSRCKG